MSLRLKEDEYKDIDFSTSKDIIERKMIINNPTSEIVNVVVKNAFKHLRNPNGASFKDICKYLEENYEIRTKDLKSCVKDALEEGMNIGLFEEKNEAFFLKRENSKRKVFVEKKSEIKEEKGGKGAKNVLYVPTKILRDIPMHKNVNFEKKEETPFPTPEMLILMIKYSIKNLKKSTGASFEEICMYLEDRYGINTKIFNYCIEQILKDCVDKKILEKVKGEKFRVKE